MPAWLSISSPTITSCEFAVLAMQSMKLPGDVTTNESVDGLGTRERGCRIMVSSDDTERIKLLFSKLRAADPSIECAHLFMQSRITDGCVWDTILGASRCPYNSKEAKLGANEAVDL